jgi:hypothetical protein
MAHLPRFYSVLYLPIPTRPKRLRLFDFLPHPQLYLIPPAALMVGLKPFLPLTQRGEINFLVFSSPEKKLIEVSLL